MFRTPESPSSGRQLFIQVYYSVFYMHQYKQACSYNSVFHTEVYQLPRPQHIKRTIT
jgi:hypothetical protein